MNNALPNILVFEDDQCFQDCWHLLGQVDQGLENLHIYSSWEDFTSRADFAAVAGAVAFVDFMFDKVESSYNGVEIAERLRQMGAAKIYSTTGNPHYVKNSTHLFTEIIGKMVPNDIRALVA